MVLYKYTQTKIRSCFNFKEKKFFKSLEIEGNLNMNYKALAFVFVAAGNHTYCYFYPKIFVNSIFMCLCVCFIFQTVATYYGSVEALQCYQCNSLSNANCNTPFDTNTGSQYLVNCTALSASYQCCSVINSLSLNII